MSSSALPSYLVAASNKYPSAVNLNGDDKYGNPAPALERIVFRDVFENEFGTEAHFFLYDLVDHSGPIPRLSKALLPQLVSTGAKVEIHTIALDMDMPGHQPMERKDKERFQELLISAYEGGLDIALNWTVFYSTRAGIRMVYVLEEPIHPEEAEGLHKGMVRDFELAGVTIDTRAFDWTRAFRLPKILREGERLWTLPTFEVIFQEDERLDVKSVRPMYAPLGKMSNKASIEAVTDPKPLPEEVEAILWRLSKNERRVMTDFHKEAKRRLKGRDCFDCIFNQATIAERGSRNSVLHAYIGQATALLARLVDISPAHIYALFFEAVQTLEPDAGDPDWTDTLWKQVGYCWSHEEAKIVAEREATEQDVEKLEGLLEKVSKWCDAPELHGDPGDAKNWLVSHLIADTGASLHVMRPDGRYDSMPVRERQLCSRIRELGMTDVIPLFVPTADGMSYKPRPLSSILSAHATAVTSVEGRVGDYGGVIKNIGEDSARLIVSLYKRREDLQAVYDEDVDTWLRLLAGPAYEKLCHWIGHALAFEDGPICALSIAGHPGIGKKLLVQGLAECINTETVAAMEALDNFHTFLLYTPFVVVNEGIHDSMRSARDIADTFRHYTAGDPIEVNIKFKPPVTVRSPLRMVFTTNNTDTISILTAHRDLSPEDREALAVRLFHIDANNDAAVWLKQSGGLDFTRGWIYGDSGSPSRYRVAKHFLWLYEKRLAPEEGLRLLVEGELTETIERMTTSSGSAPLVIETLLKMVELPSHTEEGLVVDQGKIWVTSSAIVTYFRRDIGQKTGQTLNHKQVARVMRGLTHSPNPDPIRVSGVRARWHEVDAKRLLGEAIEHGYPHKRLLKVIEYAELEHSTEPIHA